MDDLIALTDTAVSHCQRLFSPSGRLSTAIEGFVARESQTELAIAITKAIIHKTHLIAEAGTGTGKTFAYLVPALVSGKKVIISTATKTLQDQLFEKDLPMLKRALGLSVRVQNLKGRANYICRYRTALHANEGRFINPECVHDILHIAEQLPKLMDGERGELPQISDDSPAWPYVTSTADNCLGAKCSAYEDCFLIKARRRAMSAQVVVINHHLFFADTRLKDEGFGELLPGVELVVFDEAHQLSEIAATFNSERFGTRQCRDWMDELLKSWPLMDLVNQPLKCFSIELDDILDELICAITIKETRLAWGTLQRIKPFMVAFDKLATWIASLFTFLESAHIGDNAALKKCFERLGEIKASLTHCCGSEHQSIQWVEVYKHSLLFHSTPFEVSEAFSAIMAMHHAAYIFTSATLTIADSFDCFQRPLGLFSADTLLLPSPFDYQQQAILYLPRGMPDPKDATYYDVFIERVVPLINACGGRTFLLFTSHKALKQVAQMLSRAIHFPLLIQGEESKPILLSRFRALGNAVLLGTATFWEGVDVKGEALSCVIIDKLPFASPFDPVVQGKMAYIKAQGQSGFDELSLPEAILALKQGVGRLIRDSEDKGVLMIADPRLTARPYGKTIFRSLPQVRKTRDEQMVLAFINELALIHESISN